MGCFDRTTTSKTDIAPMSPQEQELFNLFTADILPAYLDESGYEVNVKEYTQYWDTPEAARIQKQISNLTAEAKKAERWQDKVRLGDKIEDLKEQQRKNQEDFVPYTDYDTRKRESEELESLRAEFGVDSDQYKEAKTAETTRKVETEKQKKEIEDQFMNNMQKYLSGDFSVTPEQEQFIKSQHEGVLTAINSLEAKSLDELQDRYGKVKSSLAGTSIDPATGMKSLGETIKETGASMEDALNQVVTANQELLKMNIDDATGEISKNVAMGAIRTGRDPSDPEYTREIQNLVSREVSRGQLSLAEMEKQGRLGIAERTGAGQEEVARALSRLEEATGRERADVIRASGGGRIGVEESIANLRQRIGMGLPPSQIEAGASFSKLNEALMAQRMANAAAPMETAAFPFQLLQRERMAEATTTQKQPFNFTDYLGIGLGAASSAASIYSGYQRGNMFGRTGGGGGSRFGDFPSGGDYYA